MTPIVPVCIRSHLQLSHPSHPAISLDGSLDASTNMAEEKLRGWDFWRSIGSPKYVCAPMVDQSELAFRMLCRRYGTELAYTPMLHSRMFSTQPKYRKEQFSTCPEDRPVFAQFCGDDPQTVLAAAKLLPPGSVDAVDLNCGCPQGIARKGHYGAYLLSEPDVIEGIISTLDKELSVPSTVKIRLVNNQELQDTLNLVSRLEAAGASVLCLHGRTKEMKGQFTGPANWDAIAAVRKRVGIPLIANGGIQTFQDAERCLQVTGANAVMSSEALLEYPALFCPTRLLERVEREAEATLAALRDEVPVEVVEFAKLPSVGTWLCSAPKKATEQAPAQVTEEVPVEVVERGISEATEQAPAQVTEEERRLLQSMGWDQDDGEGALEEWEINAARESLIALRQNEGET
eukprot:s1166_g10.t1